MCVLQIWSKFPVEPMQKRDFSKAEITSKQNYWNHTMMCVFSYKFAEYFQDILYRTFMVGLMKT